MSDSADTGPALTGVLEFTYEFVKRMRNRADLMSPPSIRQTHAIPKLLSARYFRNGKISHLDLVEVAVFTTNPEDQGIGREVAEDIILGASSRKKKPETPVQYTPPRPVDADPLEAMIAKIKRERDSSRKLQDEEIEAGSEYLDNLLTRKDAPEIETALQYLTEGDIILKGLKNDDELREAAGRELLSKLGSLTSEDISRAETLGVIDRLAAAPNAAEQLVARAFRGENDLVGRFENLAKQDSATAARALRHLEELGIPTSEENEKMDKTLQQGLKNLSEVADYANELKRLPEDVTKHIQDAAQRFPLIDALEFSKRIR